MGACKLIPNVCHKISTFLSIDQAAAYVFAGFLGLIAVGAIDDLYNSADITRIISFDDNITIN